jgi:hypothetical protein
MVGWTSGGRIQVLLTPGHLPARDSSMEEILGFVHPVQLVMIQRAQGH